MKKSKIQKTHWSEVTMTVSDSVKLHFYHNLPQSSILSVLSKGTLNDYFKRFVEEQRKRKRKMTVEAFQQFIEKCSSYFVLTPDQYQKVVDVINTIFENAEEDHSFDTIGKRVIEWKMNNTEPFNKAQQVFFGQLFNAYKKHYSKQNPKPKNIPS